MKKKIMIGILIFVIAVIGAGTWFLYSFSKSFEEGFGSITVEKEDIDNFQDGLKTFMGY